MDYFTKVRSAFVSNLQGNLEAIGIQVKPGGGGDHQAAKCPFCEDSGGSASIEIHSGYLKCFQCGYGEPLFDWVARLKNVPTAWAACKLLGEAIHVELAQRGRGKPSQDLSEKELELGVTSLWDDASAKIMRDEIGQRGFSQKELQKYFLAFRYGMLVFPAINHDLSVRPSAHAWLGPWVTGAKWRWVGGKTRHGATNYLWPLHLSPASLDSAIWLCEGEWDCLVAREKFGLDAYTWTGGAGAPLNHSALPAWMARRKVVVVYDNDVWQGPNLDTYWAPDSKRMSELVSRRRNLTDRVCRDLAKICECDVSIGLVPVDPKVTWGGDFRDAWSSGAARSIDDFKLTPWSLIGIKPKVYREVRITADDIKPQEDLKVVARVGSTAEAPLWFPESTTVRCGMGLYPFCARCGLSNNFASGVIQWTETPELQAQMFAHKNPNEMITKHVIQKPTACNAYEIEHSKEGKNLHLWTMVEENEITAAIELNVLSEAPPEISSDMLVEGTTFLPREGQQSHWLLADHAHAVQRTPFSVNDYVDELKAITPWQSDRVDEIDTYFRARYADLAAHVTKIWGSDPLHMAFDLVTHTSLWYQLDGRRVRGWGDAAIIGVTRSGKSQTARYLHEHYGGHGDIVSTQGSFSIPGLISAQIRSGVGKWRNKPGLMPRNHNRMLVLDEFHFMRDKSHSIYPIDYLQEARDQGVIYIQKAASAKFNAAVRLITISNPIGDGGFGALPHPCEQLFELYGKAETISRLDFLCVITDDMAIEAQLAAPANVLHVFTQKACQALLRRAWEIAEHDIIFEAKALDLAQDTVLIWNGVYSPEIPLHAGQDKIRSILRMAIAVANLCFSHPNKEPTKTIVREAHVKCAVTALEYYFESSGYGAYSLKAPDKKQISHVFAVEWLLLRYVSDPSFASNVLRNLLGEFNPNDLMMYLNLDLRQVTEWHHKMFSAGALSRRKINTFTQHLSLRLTKQANALCRRLMQLAEEAPDEYVARRNALETWSRGRRSEDPAITSLISL